jgi:hypothetical protein
MKRKCSKCGSYGPFYKDKPTRRYSICKSCHGIAMAKWWRSKNGKFYSHKKSRTLKSRFGRLIRAAKIRNIKVEITFEHWKEKIKSNQCHYCKLSLSETGGNLDRVNSKLGYTLKNTVPCCKACQLAKNNYTEKEFFLHIKKLSNSAWFKKWSQKI